MGSQGLLIARLHSLVEPDEDALSSGQRDHRLCARYFPMRRHDHRIASLLNGLRLVSLTVLACSLTTIPSVPTGHLQHHDCVPADED